MKDFVKLHNILSEEEDYVCIIQDQQDSSPRVIVKTLDLENDLKDFFLQNNIKISVVRGKLFKR